MNAPTPEEARGLSQILAAAFPRDENPSTDPFLEARIALAASLVSSLTCRKIGADAVGEEVPAGKVPLAKQAVIAKAEQLQIAFGNAGAATESYANGNLQSFTAGPYSESYFGPDAMMKAMRLDPNPLIHEILWGLATDDCRLYWLSLWNPKDHPVAPAAGLVAYDYGARPGYTPWF